MATEAAIAARPTAQPIDLFEMARHISGINPYACVALEALADGPIPPLPDRALPQPTRDLALLIADMDDFGYCIIAEALPADIRLSMLDRIVAQHEAEVELGLSPPTPGGEDRVANLLMKGAVFQHAVNHPLADAVLTHALGADYLLSVLGSVRTRPGSLAQGLHVDQAYIGFPTPVSAVCNTVMMLEDFTEETGATRIVPGSHRWPPRQTASLSEGIGLHAGTGLENPPGTVAAEAPAGSCMVFDGRLLHGTGRNRSETATRTGIFAYYCRPWMRQFENPHLSIDDETMMALPVAIRERLGYRPWMLLGGSQAPGAPAPLDVVRPTRLIGEASPARRGA